MNSHQFPSLSSSKWLASGLAVLLCAGPALAQDKVAKVAIRGSNTIGEELAPQLIAAYKKDHPNVTFDLEFKGTAYGLGALMGGFCDIAAASKPVSKEQEEIAQIRNFQFKESIPGSYVVTILVNAGNPVSNLTSNQVQAIFTGKIVNWKDVGGKDAPIHLLARDPVSGTHLGFKELAMNNQDYGEPLKLFTNYVNIAEAVAKDPDGVGYNGLNLTQPAGTKTVSVDGVVPSAEAVNGKKYPYTRTLRFYCNSTQEPEAAKNFLNFVLSPDGQKIMTQMGYAPKP